MGALDGIDFRYKTLFTLCDSLDEFDNQPWRKDYSTFNKFDLRFLVKSDIVEYIEHLCTFCSAFTDSAAEFVMKYFGEYVSLFEHNVDRYHGDIEFFITPPIGFRILVEAENILDHNFAQLLYKVYHDIALTFLAYNSGGRTEESSKYLGIYEQMLTNYAKENLNDNTWTFTQYDSDSWLYDDYWFI